MAPLTNAASRVIAPSTIKPKSSEGTRQCSLWRRPYSAREPTGPPNQIINAKIVSFVAWAFRWRCFLGRTIGCAYFGKIFHARGIRQLEACGPSGGGETKHIERFATPNWPLSATNRVPLFWARRVEFSSGREQVL